MRVLTDGRQFGLPLTIVLSLTLMMTVAPAVAATSVGPKAVVTGRLSGPVKVTVRLLGNDSLRVCSRGSGLADAVGQWASDNHSGKHRRSVYAGSGCSSFKHSFTAGDVVRYRACFADPRHPHKLLCGKWRHTSAA